MQTYKIGTRGSLLAVTQSTLMKNELEALSGDKFELVLIKTQGDQITNKPLWQLEGKDFFTKELDEALLKGEVDLVIHSYKDLGSVRPDGIKLGAITERKFAHDILLIPKENVAKLRSWSGDFIVGTSSPRRIVNVQKKLKKYFPFSTSENVSLRCETLRGNVNSRIQKLRDGQYHAIVLALAGIERLATGEGSRDEIAGLLQGLDFMILPQSVFPSAASQGALGIELLETRNDGGKLLSTVERLNHAGTIEEINRERRAFKEYGGGCHLAVGIHVKKIGDHYLHVHSGEVDERSVEVKHLEGQELPKLAQNSKLFIGLPSGEQAAVYDEFISKAPLLSELDLGEKNVFFTTRYALDTLRASKPPRSLWAAGSKSAEVLARNGFWVNGTSDSLGTDELRALQDSCALNLIKDLRSDWATLTHPDSRSDLGAVIPSYTRRENAVSEAFEESLRAVGACFWTSFPQYQAYLKRFPFLSEAQHFCGLGKTWQEFHRNAIAVTPLASMQDFYDLKG